MVRRRLGLLLTAALALSLAAAGVAAEGPRVELAGLPPRAASGQSVTLHLRVRDTPGTQAEVEVSTLLADRAVGSSVWKVPLTEGRGEQEVALPLPETRTRVRLHLAAQLLTTTPPVETEADLVLLPRWDAERLTDVLRGREVAVVDWDKLVAPALGKVPFSEVVPTDPLGVERFQGDLLICHFPQFRGVSDDVLAALAHQLAQGRSVVWLVKAGPAPAVLHSGPLVEVPWPFALRPACELPSVLPGDVQQWGGRGEPLPLPFVASVGSAWLIVCSDDLLTHLANEPAAGWLWEDLLAWTAKPVTASAVRRLSSPREEVPATAEPLVVYLLDLRGDEWVQPDEPHTDWLASLRPSVGKGNALLIVGADADRAPALTALGLPPATFTPVQEPPDLHLAPNLLLWRLPRVDPSYGLLTRLGERGLLKAYYDGNRLFASFPVGKGVIFLCQPDFAASVQGVDYDLLDHLARQFLSSPGRLREPAG